MAKSNQPRQSPISMLPKPAQTHTTILWVAAVIARQQSMQDRASAVSYRNPPRLILPSSDDNITSRLRTDSARAIKAPYGYARRVNYIGVRNPAVMLTRYTTRVWQDDMAVVFLLPQKGIVLTHTWGCIIGDRCISFSSSWRGCWVQMIDQIFETYHFFLCVCEIQIFKKNTLK